ncbi:DedA family protein [Dietzia sp. B32]|uniref:DedA family protein n=1 Tax=Dietzia sp. B32 TaxID=2915130 RepID=UPI0021ADC75E|nr:DedA family protein [Dietzia sp. B32]UVE93710.1 DedA family protein [Dietzia sp. B32]
MDALGGPGAAIIVGLENVFPPIPSEVILPLAGFSAAQGTFTLAGAIFWTTLGSVLGALLAYGLGFWLGAERVRTLFRRVPLIQVEDFDKAEGWFSRHGNSAVFFGRMVPVVRSLISIPAGVERMNPALFLLLTTAGSLLWNSLFVVGGYLLGGQWHRIESVAGWFSNAVVAVIVVLVAVFLGRRAHLERKERREHRDATRG